MLLLALANKAYCKAQDIHACGEPSPLEDEIIELLANIVRKHTDIDSAHIQYSNCSLFCGEMMWLQERKIWMQ